ncbi:MAG: hypothetical protein PVH30_01495, partial [Desulfobacterales bacterium]
MASHNRPVFVVRRLENDDFMVVSDINAGLGLFPQKLIEETINALDELQQRLTIAVAEANDESADPVLLRNAKTVFAQER